MGHGYGGCGIDGVLSPQASLCDVVRQFEQELCRYQRFWDTMDQLDRETLVLEPERPSRGDTQRRIVIGLFRGVREVFIFCWFF